MEKKLNIEFDSFRRSGSRVGFGYKCIERGEVGVNYGFLEKFLFIVLVFFIVF